MTVLDDDKPVMPGLMSDVLDQEIAWIKKIHSRYPPRDELSAISLFYSKLNDTFDCMAARVHDNRRGLSRKLYDASRNLYVFVVQALSILMGASLFSRKMIDHTSLFVGNYIVIDYLNAQGSERIGVPFVSKGNQEEFVVTFHEKKGFTERVISAYGLMDALKFLVLLVRISNRIPLVQGYAIESLVEKTRELTNFYLFQFYLVAKELAQGGGEIVMLYEDQPRDRLLLYYLKNYYKITAYVHSPASHLYRYNLLGSDGDILSPDAYLCKYYEKASMLASLKNIDTDLIASINDHGVYCDLRGFQFYQVVVYLPKSIDIINEYQRIFSALALNYDWQVSFVAHPSTPKLIKENVWNVDDDPEVCVENTLVVSSFMTNKGYYMIEEGYKVVYLGSDILPWYNPFPGIDVPFVQSPESFRNSLLEMGSVFIK